MQPCRLPQQFIHESPFHQQSDMFQETNETPSNLYVSLDVFETIILPGVEARDPCVGLVSGSNKTKTFANCHRTNDDLI